MDIMTAHQVACGEARAEAPVLEEILPDGYPRDLLGYRVM